MRERERERERVSIKREREREREREKTTQTQTNKQIYHDPMKSSLLEVIHKQTNKRSDR